MNSAEFGTRLGCVSLHVLTWTSSPSLSAMWPACLTLRSKFPPLETNPSFSSSSHTHTLIRSHSSFLFNQCTALLSTDLFSIFGLVFTFQIPSFHFHWDPSMFSVGLCTEAPWFWTGTSFLERVHLQIYQIHSCIWIKYTWLHYEFPFGSLNQNDYNLQPC